MAFRAAQSSKLQGIRLKGLGFKVLGCGGLPKIKGRSVGWGGGCDSKDPVTEGFHYGVHISGTHLISESVRLL